MNISATGDPLSKTEYTTYKNVIHVNVRKLFTKMHC